MKNIGYNFSTNLGRATCDIINKYVFNKKYGCGQHFNVELLVSTNCFIPLREGNRCQNYFVWDM